MELWEIILIIIVSISALFVGIVLSYMYFFRYRSRSDDTYDIQNHICKTVNEGIFRQFSRITGNISPILPEESVDLLDSEDVSDNFNNSVLQIGMLLDEQQSFISADSSYSPRGTTFSSAVTQMDKEIC